MDVRGKRITVFGMARSGVATLGLLRREGADARASDARERAVLPEFEGEFVEQGEAAIEGTEVCVLSPGVPRDLPLFAEAERRGLKVVGDVEAASWFLRGPVVGITGANGKTTTTALVGHLLEAAGIECQVGGNIGRPVASMVETSRAGQWNVLELSSFQLETCETLRVEIAAVLNVTPDHLDRHGSFERYAAAKARILMNQRAGDWAVLNAESGAAAALAGEARGGVRWFNAGGRSEPGSWIEGGELVMDGVAWMKTGEVGLRGRHNLENVLAAAECARLAGAGRDALRGGVMTFGGVEHRIEYVMTIDGVDYYNDSKATNVDATVKALESFEGGLWVILGGKDKGSDYTVLRPLLEARARGVLLIGAAAEKIAGQLAGMENMRRCGDLAGALGVARREARAGETVLLAPACASFDQFSGYEERGRVFKSLVKTMEGGR